MDQSWLLYAIVACITYTVFAICIVVLSRRSPAFVKKDALVVLALILFVVGGAIAFGLLAFVPSLRDQFLRTYTESSEGRGIVLAIVLLACLMLTTHLCVYISIVKAPNAGYAQAVVNVSALLIALIMWGAYRQELSSVALAGIALITVGSGMLKLGI
jgi:hypothetical protein